MKVLLSVLLRFIVHGDCLVKGSCCRRVQSAVRGDLLGSSAQCQKAFEVSGVSP